jgi:4-nitrophenyl phosphatase
VYRAAHVSRHRPEPPTEPAARERSGTPAAITALAFDLDGTIYLQSQLLPGALDLLEALAAGDVPFVFATNNSSKTGEAYVRSLRALGISVTRERIVTSNDVAADYLRREGFARPYLIATPDVTQEYAAHGFAEGGEGADCVVLTFDTTLTYEKLLVADRLIRRGVPYFATHPDRVCPTLDGSIPDCGAFIELLAASSGRRPLVLGKPEPFMAHAIGIRLERPAAEIAFVGDRLYTDVRMANDHGFHAVLTLTGEASRDDVAGSAYQPDLIVETLASLHDHLGDRGLIEARKPAGT